jgi:hypothetical protein
MLGDLCAIDNVVRKSSCAVTCFGSDLDAVRCIDIPSYFGSGHHDCRVDVMKYLTRREDGDELRVLRREDSD